MEGIRWGPLRIRGKVVYGDTDSTMFLVDNKREQLFPEGNVDFVEEEDLKKTLELLDDAELKDTKDRWNVLSIFLGSLVEREINKTFPPPIVLEPDPPKVLLCIKKKKYAGYKINSDGTVDNSDKGLIAKGITIARRDNCPLLREIYTKVLKSILDSTKLSDILSYLNAKLLEIVSGQVSYKDFIMIKGVSTTYKSDSAVMKVFSDELAKLGHPVSPGDRLEFVYFQRDGSAEKVGKRMMIPEIFLREKYKLDYHYYLTNVIQKPIDQLLQVGFHNTKDNHVKVMIKAMDGITNINRFIRSLVPIDMIPELYPVKIVYMKYKNKIVPVALSFSPLFNQTDNSVFSKRKPFAEYQSVTLLCERLNARLQERLISML